MQSWHLSPKHPYLHLHVPSKWLQVPPFKHVSALQLMQFILQSLNVDEYSKQLLLWTMVRALCVLFIGYTFILSFSSWIQSFGMPFARQHAVKQSSILTEVRILRWISLFQDYRLLYRKYINNIIMYDMLPSGLSGGGVGSIGAGILANPINAFWSLGAYNMTFLSDLKLIPLII